MNERNEVTNRNDTPVENDPSATPPADAAPSEDEFQITVRKLDAPVRPRGVLAE